MIEDAINLDMPEGWIVTAVILRGFEWEVTAGDDNGNYVMKQAWTIEEARLAAVEAIETEDYWRVSSWNKTFVPRLSLASIGLADEFTEEDRRV